ncbi:Periplasmic binding protein [uncultured Clostridium sp.]|nr:Periplasmic binding protein [uncultured Clostridium sp.]
MKRWSRKVMIAAAVMLAGSLPQAATAEESQTAETEEVSSMVTVQQLGLEDGTYIADGTLEGGSGRATISSPVELTVKDGQMTARIEFSSPYYDYMIVDGEKYEPENTEGNSQFTIPMAGFDAGVPVTADTVAMSEPHEIDYEIVLDSATLKSWDGQTKESEAVTEADTTVPDETTENTDGVKSTGTGLEHEILEIPGLTYDHSMELEYATQFAVDYYQDDYAVITIAQEGSYLVVPEGKEAPEGLDKEIKVLQQPLDHIYLVATSSMDLFRAIGGIENITLSGTDANGWYIEEAKEAMENGNIQYAGKYSAPDYELILANGCDLAIESTMIYHSPDVREKLEEFGIPVLVEHSSYESDPLGRMEWLKLYAVLLDKEEEADAYFQSQTDMLTDVLGAENTEKTIAFFSINSNGYVTVRKTGDYISKMIELAGGRYIFQNLGNDNALSTMNMQMEDFYAGACDADYIIYNSAIESELHSLDELLEKSSLLADFKAVKEGNVWCTEKSLFQETTGIATMISDMHTMLTSDDPDLSQLTYMYRLTDTK